MPQQGRPELIDPNEDYRAQLLDYLEEYVAGQLQADAPVVPPEEIALVRDIFPAWLRRRRSFAAGKDLLEGHVPWNEYWLVLEGRILGRVRLRHRLTPALEDRGGHIGYEVRPSERGKGYATRMLELCLEKARALGMTRVMLTCARSNAASARVIEKNGGVLAYEGPALKDGTVIRRYWIEL